MQNDQKYSIRSAYDLGKAYFYFNKMEKILKKQKLVDQKMQNNFYDIFEFFRKEYDKLRELKEFF